MWTNVFDRGRLQAGESALFHGGSSGIGTTAIQMASARGARVYATAGSDEKCRACESLGAARAINYRREDFVDAIRDLTDGRGVDLVLDIVGGSYVARNLSVLAMDGRLVQIGLMEGDATATVDFRRILGTAPDDDRVDAAAAQRRREGRDRRGPAPATCGRCSRRAW